MDKLKTVLAINDISCIGKCSLTVILPILSAMDIKTSILPTTILSSPTGYFGTPCFINTTKDLKNFINHWESLNIKFDSIYSGYLSSSEQINIVKEIIKKFKKEDTIVLIDPVMADNGKLYEFFNLDFKEKIKSLVSYGNIITPNITEAFLLTKEQYFKGPYDKKFIDKLLLKLIKLGPENIVITGIDFKDSIGIATINKNKKDINYIIEKKIKGIYYGTGDIFNSVLLGSILNNLNLEKSCKIASKFILESIKLSNKNNYDIKFGINFEKILYKLKDYIKK